MKKRLRLLVFFVVVLITGVLYVAPRMLESSIPSIYYTTPTRKNYENIVNCTGTVHARQIRTVYSQMSVVPSQVYVQVGDTVAAGDVLLRVDVDKTKALTGYLPEILENFSTEAATGGLSIPETVDWAALASLYGLNSGVISGGGLDLGALEGLLDGGAAVPEVVAMPVNGEIPEVIVAPISGIITDVGVREDVPAGPGKAMFTIVDTGDFKVMATVNEADIAKIRQGDSAKVRGVGFGGRVYNGEVDKIYPTARRMLSGASTETVVDVEIKLHNADERLKSGFSARVEIVGGEDYMLLTVPYEAIRQDSSNLEYVYVYEQGRIKKAMIVTGQELINEVQVLSGLTEESIVVFNPGNLIREGGMIHIKGRADGY